MLDSLLPFWKSELNKVVYLIHHHRDVSVQEIKFLLFIYSVETELSFKNLKLVYFILCHTCLPLIQSVKILFAIIKLSNDSPTLSNAFFISSAK